MPRDGSGIYSRPPGTDGVPDTSIESTKYNSNVADVETDLNAPRPIIAGGTGANNATQARDNLDAEVARQIVTNFDTHVFEFGSLYANTGATGAPNTARSYSGFCHGFDNNNLDIEVRDMNDPVTPGARYIRQKRAGVWSAWYPGNFHNVDQAIVKANPSLILDKTATTGQSASILGGCLGLPRWRIDLGDGTAESPTAAGSNFNILAYNNAGALLSTPLTITRSSGDAVFAAQVTAPAYLLAGTSARIYTSATHTIICSPTNLGAISAGSGGTPINYYDNTSHEFRLANGTSGTAVTIHGTLGIGATAGTSPGETTATGVAIDGLGVIRVSKNAPYLGVWNLNTDGVMIYINRSATGCGSVAVTSTTTSWNISSDERLKEDLKSFDAGNIVDDTNVYDFKWRSTGERSYGIIAQQANTVYPAAVTYDPEKDWWGIDLSKYVPIILQELKSLRKRVAELEEKLAAGAQPA